MKIELKTKNYCFEIVERFKYLIIRINNHNNYHEEIRLILKL